MSTNKRKRQDLRGSANAVGQTKLSFFRKYQVFETEEVTFISKLKHVPTCNIIAHFSMDLIHYLTFLKACLFNRETYI